MKKVAWHNEFRKSPWTKVHITENNYATLCGKRLPHHIDDSDGMKVDCEVCKAIIIQKLGREKIGRAHV